MGEVIPSVYGDRPAGHAPAASGFRNNLLRPGEIHRAVYPDDPRSRTRQFVEYDVLVQHREGGTAVTKLMHNCIPANALMGLADFSFFTLRQPDAPPGTPASAGEVAGPGSKVLVLCINGEEAEGVIVAGMRDDRQSDDGRKQKGHHLDWVFNGLAVNIADDGGLTVTRTGPTKANGNPDPGRGDASANGAKIAAAADGSVSAGTANGEASVKLDQKQATATVHGDQQVVLDGSRVALGGAAAFEAVPHGTTWRTADAAWSAQIDTFLGVLVAYAAQIQPIADSTGSATSALLTGVAALLLGRTAYEAAAANFLSTQVSTL